MADDETKTGQNGDEKQSLAKLIRLAGERPDIPLGIESRVYNRVQEEWRNSSAEASGDDSYDAVHESWRRGARRSNLFRWLVPVGIAAAAVVVVLVSSRPEVLPPPVAATVARVIDAEQAGSRYLKGTEVHAGELVSTVAGEGLSLLLARGESLRVDQNTRVRVESSDRFTLLSGRVYADTGLYVFREGGLVIDTAFGSITDIGTQFSVGATSQALEVAVREGRVDIRSDSGDYAARMGQRLVLEHGRDAEVGAIDAHDEYWSWTAELAPAFDTSNRSLLDFLKWAVRETGRELQFDSDDTRMFAMRTDISGSIEGLTPDEALTSILATTSVRYQIESDKVLIEKQ